jgi:hypothetical protein
MIRSAAVLLLTLAACATSTREDGRMPAAGSLQLCVRNGAAAYGNIVARAGQVRFDVMPGREECKSIPGAGSTVQLVAETTAGGSAGPVTYRTTLQTGNVGCWRWRLTESPASANDLSPCEYTP